MRYLIKIDMPSEAASSALKEPGFGDKIDSLLHEIHAEAAYFTAVDGHGRREVYIFVNVDDSAQLSRITGPLFLRFKANVEFLPVMVPREIARVPVMAGRA